MAAKLKTFITSNGLTDFVVATTSKAKALAAWGVGQDLFKAGQAHETDDPALVDLAGAEPGKVVQRAATTQEAIRALKPATVEKKPPQRPPTPTAREAAAPAEAKVIPLPKPKPPEPAQPTAAQQRRVSEAQAKLEAARATHKAELTGMETETARLDADLEAAASELARLKKELAALEKKQGRLKGERDSLEARAQQERKRFTAQEGILKARLEAAKAALA